jgi:hypothetical protein
VVERGDDRVVVPDAVQLLPPAVPEQGPGDVLELTGLVGVARRLLVL